MIKYKSSKLGMTESIISINIFKENQNIETKNFINYYEISNLFRGKFFIKRLIKKVFKYKLNSKIKWNKFFWDKIIIKKVSSNISYSDRFKNKNDFENYITSNYSKNRIKDILNLKNLIINNKNIDCPLYINGVCLNYLGACVDRNTIYMLDGSRRLISNVSSGIKNIELYIIDFKND